MAASLRGLKQGSTRQRRHEDSAKLALLEQQGTFTLKYLEICQELYIHLSFVRSYCKIGSPDCPDGRSGHRPECMWKNMLHIIHKSIIIDLGFLPTGFGHQKMCPYRLRNPHNKSGWRRQTEDLLSASLIHGCFIHIIPSLFAAMGMHAVNVRSDDIVLEQLGYIKIRLSIIALKNSRLPSRSVGGTFYNSSRSSDRSVSTN